MVDDEKRHIKNYSLQTEATVICFDMSYRQVHFNLLFRYSLSVDKSYAVITYNEQDKAQCFDQHDKQY